MSYALVRIKRFWISEGVWRWFAHKAPWLTVRPPLVWILTRRPSPFERFKVNGSESEQ